MRVNLFAACVCVAALLAGGRSVAAAELSLADAAEHQEAAAIRAQLAKKADVNAAQADGMTALHWATYHDDLDTVKLFVSAGADVRKSNRYGVSPSVDRLHKRQHGELSSCYSKQARIRIPTLPGGETALMTASRTGRLGPVKALFARAPMSTRVNTKDRRR